MIILILSIIIEILSILCISIYLISKEKIISLKKENSYANELLDNSDYIISDLFFSLEEEIHFRNKFLNSKY